MTATVEVRRLDKHYGALRALNLTVQQGEIFGLLGANGAGKTTLIKILIGITRPTAGQVSVLGMNPAREVWALRQQIGYMPQTPVLYDDLSAWENVRFFGKAHNLPDLNDRLASVLEFVDLATLQSLLVLVTLRLLFNSLDYTLATFAAVYGVIWLLAIISIALGIFVSNFARNEGPWAQWLSVFTPLYYASETLRDVTLNQGQMLIVGLLAYGFVVVALATLTLREQS